MSKAWPVVTIVVPARPGQAEISAVSASRALDYPRENLEILVTRGRQPAIQRNVAIKAARGELIYFLDDDALPQPGNLRRGIPHFENSAVAMVGGPNLCPAEAPPLEQVFAIVLGSWLAFGPSRARYDTVGRLRHTGEKELILCNLMARRSALQELGGFDESLYPNEENALMDELQRRGLKLIYDPEFIVHRRPRPHLKAFIKMLLNYGRGRAEQFRLHPTPGSILNFAPPLFCLFVLALPFLGKLGLAALAVYFAALLVQTILSSFGKGMVKSLLALPLIVLTHLVYGLGFWRGLFTKLTRPGTKPSTEVTLEKITF